MESYINDAYTTIFPLRSRHFFFKKKMEKFFKNIQYRLDREEADLVRQLRDGESDSSRFLNSEQLQKKYQNVSDLRDKLNMPFEGIIANKIKQNNLRLSQNISNQISGRSVIIF